MLEQRELDHQNTINYFHGLHLALSEQIINHCNRKLQKDKTYWYKSIIILCFTLDVFRFTNKSNMRVNEKWKKNTLTKIAISTWSTVNYTNCISFHFAFVLRWTIFSSRKQPNSDCFGGYNFSILIRLFDSSIDMPLFSKKVILIKIDHHGFRLSIMVLHLWRLMIQFMHCAMIEQ